VDLYTVLSNNPYFVSVQDKILQYCAKILKQLATTGS
jgi:hypothetical protein